MHPLNRINIKCGRSVSSAPILVIIEYIKKIGESGINIEWSADDASPSLDIRSEQGQPVTFSSTTTICRFLARILFSGKFYGSTILEKTEVDHWVEIFSCGRKYSVAEFKVCIEKLNKTLTTVTYLVGDAITLADISVWCTLLASKVFQNQLTEGSVPTNVLRWYNYLSGIEEFKTVREMLGLDEPQVSVRETMKKTVNEDRGKFVDLPGAEMGEVTVRFPPEASGFLHIGHAKAALLNAHYQTSFAGKLILRFDDTNPEKEKEDFEKVILEDVTMLQITPDIFTYTSDHFNIIQGKCEELLKRSLAYVDDTDPETMKQEREQRQDSKNRNNDVSKNWSMWEEMQKGTEYGKSCCIRGKIDMKSDNGCLRDPTLYRCKATPHPRTGSQYKIYPTYDFACPIVDSIEGVTHALRTTEYHDRDDQYFWVLDTLKLRKPYIYEYSRLNMTHTVLSKRKLTWFVEQGIVDGWDDPRMPTVRGVLRRGMTVEGLKQFIVAQGSSRSVVVMEWDKIWAFNKKVIDPLSPRYNTVEKDNCVPVLVEAAEKQVLRVARHPKNPELGTKDINVGPKLLVDYADAEAMKIGDNVTFINWGNLLITDVKRKVSGEIECVTAKLNLENKDYKKTLKVTWVADLQDVLPLIPCACIYYDHLISKAVLGKDDDFKNFLNDNTIITVMMLGDPDLAHLKKGDIIQIQRKGFFICDVPYDPSSTLRYTSREGPLVLISIPDGTRDTSIFPAAVKNIRFRNESSKEKMNTLKGKVAEKSPQDEKQSISIEFGASSFSENQQTDSNLETESSLSLKIKAQGDRLRKLKLDKADKKTIDSNVQLLLSLKKDYKNLSGQEWNPTKIINTNGAGNDNTALILELSQNISIQGNKVRQLKSQKADKSMIDSAVQQLLVLKKQFKDLTGKEWKPEDVVSQPVKAEKQATSSALELSQKIKRQGDMIRELKSQKADKSTVDSNVQQLLLLKKQFKDLTGKEWKPEDVISQPVKDEKQVTSSALELSQKIKRQGDTIRELKTQKADKSTVDSNVQQLLLLKKQFKDLTGKEWKPEDVTTSPIKVEKESSFVTLELLQNIKRQGDTIRELKSQKADKSMIDGNVQQLLVLKKQFKDITGRDWKPEDVIKPVQDEKILLSDACKELSEKIKCQGDTVRNLKSQKTDKSIVDSNIQELLKLKAEYKIKTGSDWKPEKQVLNELSSSNPQANNDEFQPDSTLNSNRDGKPSNKQKINKEKQKNNKTIIATNETVDSTVKKITRLGLEAKKEENLADWYSQVLTKAEMIEYYDVSGCYILRPWAYSIWESIQKFFDGAIKNLGVTNCYFPMFVSSHALEKEKTHIEDFAPEVAWVTKSGNTDLEKPIAIRPTSETVMYPSYAKWIRSHRDLPLRLNQWCSVVRWEFRNPQPFIRTREFLWQEGHTAFANQEEAVNEVHAILELYGQVYENLLAIPVIRGKKTEKEKFAGADFTTTAEAYVAASGRGIQGATSHHLGQNFSKMFEIVYEDPDTTEKQFVFQNSWGLSTRSIGAMVMIHGDNIGLVLPPRVAAHQVVIVPCGITVTLKESEKDALLVTCQEFESTLRSAGVSVKGDYRENYSPGWKFNYWELKGVPIRVEIGPKDMKKNQFVAVRRDTSEKSTLGMDTAPNSIVELLDAIHDSMYEKAKKSLDDHLCVSYDWHDFCEKLDQRFIIQAPFCGEIPCEDKIKKESAKKAEELAELDPGAPSMGAKSLCIPFQQPAEIQPNTKCINPNCENKPKNFTLFGRSY